MDMITAHVDKYLGANPSTSLSTRNAVDAAVKAILQDLSLDTPSASQHNSTQPHSSTSSTPNATAGNSSTDHPPSPDESPTTSPRNSALLPPGTEWKALTIYQTLQDRDHTHDLQKTKYLNSLQISKELAQQVASKNAQFRRERDEDQRYFSDFVLKDIQKYHRECEEIIEAKRRANETHRILLRKQKESEARRRSIDDRETARLQLQRDRESYEAEERAQQEKKRKMQLKYRSELLTQIKEQQRNIGREDVMTKTERSLNRSDLDMLKDDPVKSQLVKNMLLKTAPAVPNTSLPSAVGSSPVKRGRRLKGWEGME